MEIVDARVDHTHQYVFRSLGIAPCFRHGDLGHIPLQCAKARVVGQQIRRAKDVVWLCVLHRRISHGLLDRRCNRLIRRNLDQQSALTGSLVSLLDINRTGQRR